MAIEHAASATQGHDFRTIERKWQERWEADRLYATRLDDPRPPYYTMEMLPYPSGDLHVGHAKNYTLGDAVARLMRMHGYNVLHPLGLGRLRIARRKRRDPARDRAARLDAEQHRKHEAPDSLARHGLRLVARVCDLRPGVLSLESMDLLAFVREGSGIQARGSGQLVSLRSNRARQRASRRRQVLALRQRGRTAPTLAVVLEDHRIRGSVARGSRSSATVGPIASN